MRELHDPTVSRALRARIEALRPDATRRWGKMTVDQMLWHVNQALASAIGEIQVPRHASPMAAAFLGFFVLTGRFQSRLQAKHLNHHLRQFSA